jgi:hypothetical protein
MTDLTSTVARCRMTTDDTIGGRVDEWASRRGLRVGGYNPWAIIVDAVRAGVGTASRGRRPRWRSSLAGADPVHSGVGGVLGYIEPWAGPNGVERTETVVTGVMTIILGAELVVDVADRGRRHGVRWPRCASRPCGEPGASRDRP